MFDIVASAIRNAGSTNPPANMAQEAANKADFTDDAWNEINSLSKNAKGETMSNATSGRKIHRGFRTDSSGRTTGISIKGAGRTTGKYGFTDSFDDITKTIYELKPNNARSIAQGLKQLNRYSDAYMKNFGVRPNLVLVLY